MGGKFHLKLNMGSRPIANKYHEGKMKRTLKRELKVPEIAEREANEISILDKIVVRFASCLLYLCKRSSKLLHESALCFLPRASPSVHIRGKCMVARLWVRERTWPNSIVNCACVSGANDSGSPQSSLEHIPGSVTLSRCFHST